MSSFSYISYLKKPNLIWLIIGLALINMITWWVVPRAYIIKYYAGSEVLSVKRDYQNNSQNTIPFVLVLCMGSDHQMTSEHLGQIRLLLKSAAALTHVTLNFIIYSDSESLYQDIIKPMIFWPPEHQSRLNVNFQPVKYPSSIRGFRSLFRPCATFRDMLPDLLLHVDAVVYLDADNIFLQPPEHIWREFLKFDDKEALALSPVTYYPQYMIKYPIPGYVYNSGVMLMNFTRLRVAPEGGFSSAIQNVYRLNKRKATGDQSLINMLFVDYPELLHELSCKWNYFYDNCARGTNLCLEAEKHGASLVHGAGGAFKLPDAFKELRNAWDEYEIGKPIKTLIEKIKYKLKKQRSLIKGKKCIFTKNIESIFIKQLSNHSDKRLHI